MKPMYFKISNLLEALDRHMEKLTWEEVGRKEEEFFTSIAGYTIEICELHTTTSDFRVTILGADGAVVHVQELDSNNPVKQLFNKVRAKVRGADEAIESILKELG